MLADIAHGHVDVADVLLLIAAIVFAVAAVLPVLRRSTLEVVLIPAGLCLTALALLLL